MGKLMGAICFIFGHRWTVFYQEQCPVEYRRCSRCEWIRHYCDEIDWSKVARAAVTSPTGTQPAVDRTEWGAGTAIDCIIGTVVAVFAVTIAHVIVGPSVALPLFELGGAVFLFLFIVKVLWG